MKFIDSHAHLSSPDVLPHMEGMIERARAAGLTHLLNICTDPSSLQEGLALQKRFPWIGTAAATPPQDVQKEGIEWVIQAARSHQLLAIGETGLDYHYSSPTRDLQLQGLEQTLRLAAECKLPVIFHCREAFQDLFACTDRFYPKAAPAVLHCFTGNHAEAMQGVERGWMVSFSGILTFKKSDSLRTVARSIPLEQLLVETDTPYLAPQSKRGQRNEPSFLIETVACLAELKGLSLEKMAQITSENALRTFRFQKSEIRMPRQGMDPF